MSTYDHDEEDDYSSVSSSYELFKAQQREKLRQSYEDDDVMYKSQQKQNKISTPTSRPRTGYDTSKSFDPEEEVEYLNLMKNPNSARRNYSDDEGDDKYDVEKSDFNQYMSQRNLELKKYNDQIKAESELAMKQASQAMKEQERKLKEQEKNTIVAPPRITSRPGSSAGRKPTTPARPSSAINNIQNSDSINFSNGLDSEDPEDELDAIAKRMGTEAAMKFYRARVKALERDVKEVYDKLKDRETKLTELDQKYKESNSENKKLNKAATQHQQRVDKQKKDHDILQDKYKNLNSQLNEVRKELEITKKEAKKDQLNAPKGTPTTGGKDVRLNRAMEEIEKYKNQINDLNKEKREATENLRKENEKLRNENKRTERQKQDLLLAFRKQMKLIDILKRQKIHLEAARLLAFTEEEFSKTLDIGQEK